MTPDDAVVAVIDTLDRAAVPYMIVGSLASNVHGIPRSSADADFVIEVESRTLHSIGDALPKELQLDPQGSFETVTGTLRSIIVLRGSPFVCELFALSDDPHDRERFRRRERVQILGRISLVASAEDMIITKLRWAAQGGRGKDRDDARNIIAVREFGLDWDYVEKWAATHATLDLLNEIRASIPPGT